MIKKIKEFFVIRKLKKNFPELSKYLDNSSKNKISAAEMKDAMNELSVLSYESSAPTQTFVDNMDRVQEKMSEAGYSFKDFNTETN